MRSPFSDLPSNSETAVPLANYIHGTSRFETPRKETSIFLGIFASIPDPRDARSQAEK